MPETPDRYYQYQNALNELGETTLHPIYMARGNDYYLYRQFAKSVVSAFKEKYGPDAEIIQRWGAELKAISDLAFISGGGGLFSNASLIILNEIQDAGKSVKPALHEILGRQTGDTIILLHYAVSDFRRAKWLDNLESISHSIPLQSPAAEELPKYIKQMAVNYQIEISGSAIMRLIDRSAGELAIIDNELQKLSLYLGDEKKKVEADLIDDIAGSVENAQVALFVEAISNRDRSLAVRALVEIFNIGKEGLPFIVAMLFNRLIQLMTLHEKIEVRKSIGKGVTSYFFLKDLNKFSKNYSMEELKVATKELAEIDYQFRLGSSDMLTAMSAWVSKVV